jgi:hypothetical protein
VLEVGAKDKRVLVLKRPKFPPDSDEAMFDPVFPV